MCTECLEECEVGQGGKLSDAEGDTEDLGRAECEMVVLEDGAENILGEVSLLGSV